MDQVRSGKGNGLRRRSVQADPIDLPPGRQLHEGDRAWRYARSESSRISACCQENEPEEQRPSSVAGVRSEEHTSELQSHLNLVCRLLLEKKKKKKIHNIKLKKKKKKKNK